MDSKFLEGIKPNAPAVRNNTCRSCKHLYADPHGNYQCREDSPQMEMIVEPQVVNGKIVGANIIGTFGSWPPCGLDDWCGKFVRKLAIEMN